MNRNYAMGLGLLAVAAAAATLIWWPSGPADARLDVFAQCLADKGATMYGAEWCPHCQNEKKAFGEAFKFVPYVECPNEPNRCLAAGVQGYPTWVFPDGRKLEGEQGLEKLAAASGCRLPGSE